MSPCARFVFWPSFYLPAIFLLRKHYGYRISSGDKMVLQQGKPVHIWGWAKAGTEVKAQFAGQSKSAKADGEGQWLLLLDKLETSFKGRELVVTSGTEKITLTDILVGEVWVCGGQSNMEWSLRSSRDSDLEVASADSPHIRFIRLPHIARPTAQEEFPCNR